VRQFCLHLTFNANDHALEGGDVDMRTLDVYWSRILHVADNRKTSEIFGIPRLQVVYNNVIEVKKISGSSGEMFYKGAYLDSQKSKIKPQPNVVITNAADFQEGGKESFMQGGETSPTSKKTKQSLIGQAMSQLKGIAGQMVQSVKQVILTGVRKR
jgi:hypothetical protein